MKKIPVLLIAGLLGLTATVVNAYDGCKNPTSSYDSTYCTAKLFIESDKELNETYKSLTQQVNGDVKKSLVNAQRAWIKFRDNACESQGEIDVDCNYAVNKARDEFLRDRLRECKTGHCQNDLIASQNFKTSS